MSVTIPGYSLSGSQEFVRVLPVCTCKVENKPNNSQIGVRNEGDMVQTVF
jgi:hypothetical protein